MALEKEPPTSRQKDVLEHVAQRVLQEFAATHEGGDVPAHTKSDHKHMRTEEPLRGLIHGLPGTGKSQVIAWIRKFLEEALCWEHGVHFVCVAFQNSMAALIKGTTLHGAANLPRPGDRDAKKLAHSDSDNLYIKN